jgi:5,10-methenyltetrahydromethanopterin hydrogenase
MKRIVMVAAMSAGLAFSPAAFAQGMTKDKPDTMKSTSDKKMMDKKDTMAKPGAMMDKKDGMSHSPSDKMKK